MNMKFLDLSKAKGMKEKNKTNSADSLNKNKLCNIIRIRPEEHERLQETKINTISCIGTKMKTKNH